MAPLNLSVNAKKSTQQWVPELLPRKHRNPSALVKLKLTGEVITVGKLMASHQPIPTHSILLGQCNDGLPFLIELGDPELGAILVGCDEGGGKTHQLQVMVDSAMRVNDPRELQISILTLNPNEWDYLQCDVRLNKYLRGVHAWYDGRAEVIIQELTELAEARREGKRRGTTVILILDDLNFVENLSYEAQVNLHWLLAYGSQSDVWIVGAIKARHASSFQYWIEPFRTRIIGRVQSKENAQILSMRSDSQVQGLEPASFKVWTGSDWLNYRLLPLGI